MCGKIARAPNSKYYEFRNNKINEKLRKAKENSKSVQSPRRRTSGVLGPRSASPRPPRCPRTRRQAGGRSSAASGTSTSPPGSHGRILASGPLWPQSATFRRCGAGQRPGKFTDEARGTCTWRNGRYKPYLAWRGSSDRQLSMKRTKNNVKRGVTLRRICCSSAHRLNHRAT